MSACLSGYSMHLYSFRAIYWGRTQMGNLSVTKHWSCVQRRQKSPQKKASDSGLVTKGLPNQNAKKPNDCNTYTNDVRIWKQNSTIFYFQCILWWIQFYYQYLCNLNLHCNINIKIWWTKSNFAYYMDRLNYHLTYVGTHPISLLSGLI